jgi:hypothetical protein
MNKPFIGSAERTEKYFGVQEMTRRLLGILFNVKNGSVIILIIALARLLLSMEAYMCAKELFSPVYAKIMMILSLGFICQKPVQPTVLAQ